MEAAEFEKGFEQGTEFSYGKKNPVGGLASGEAYMVVEQGEECESPLGCQLEILWVSGWVIRNLSTRFREIPTGGSAEVHWGPPRDGP